MEELKKEVFENADKVDVKSGGANKKPETLKGSN